MITGLVLFRNDLRLHDNENLIRAIEYSDCLIPLFVLSDHLAGYNLYHKHIQFPRMNPFRAQFLIESIYDLREQLKRIGSDLIIRQGNSAKIIAELCFEFNIDKVFFSELPCTYEKAEEIEITTILDKIQISYSITKMDQLIHLDELPFSLDNTPEVFTQFRKLIEAKSSIALPLPKIGRAAAIPQGIETGDIPQDLLRLGQSVRIDPRAAIQFHGGETQGIRRITDYIWIRDKIKSYKQTRNEMIGEDYSSKFSAWLSLGCVSPRFIVQQIRKYEEERIKNESTYWLIFELYWRDYFRLIAAKHGYNLFQRNGISGSTNKGKTGLESNHEENSYQNIENEESDLEKFEQWRTGCTGVAFIDANMKELLLTGFMSNRGRQNVASFFVHSLKLDWRMGAEWFESQLIDYDPASNYGNWAYLAGVGNDPRAREFNIDKQAKTYDPDGKFQKLWNS